MTIRALAFDIFGTVVDWRGSIVREGAQINADKGLTADWAQIADAWRAGYYRLTREVREWVTVDVLHRRLLDDLLAQYGLDDQFDEAERQRLNRVWHRLDPWPDAADGLARLRERFVVATLSNGNMALLVNLAKHGGLTWDCVLSAELARRYKPDPTVYQLAPTLLDMPTADVLMVAAHSGDLLGARRAGLRTAFVERPGEETRAAAEPPFDVMADDFLDLAAQLGA